MSLNLPSSEEWTQRCASDGEFMLAARNWNGGITLSVGDTQLEVSVSDGQPGNSAATANVIAFSGDEAVWEKILAQVPEAELYRYSTALRSMTQGRGLHRSSFTRYDSMPRHVQDSVVAESAELEEA